jgi:hypothetical protein
VRFAAPLRPVLRDELVRLARTRATAAEITRALGELAWQEGLRRPSYARVHWLVACERSRIPEPTWGEIAVDIAYRNRLPEAVVDKAAGLLPRLDEDAGLNVPFSSRPR